MYYRRKILLALFQVFDGRLEKLRLQKLLFLVTRQQCIKSYDFVPYKFGCFSFQANADLHTLTKYNLIRESTTSWERTDETRYIDTLKEEDKVIILDARHQFGNLSTNALIKLTYQKHPYYAINSTIVKEVLNAQELKKVKTQKRTSNETVMFTIGYEGVSLETYINKLIKNDVKLLCDVRKNSFSMKYGFSKSQLSNACNGVGIKFVHIPELGIQSEKRKALNSQSDYDVLFEEYNKTVLKNIVDKQKEILQLLRSEKRIALTCFEKNINQCHRKHLAYSIESLGEFSFPVKHI